MKTNQIEQRNYENANSSPFFIIGCVRSGTTLLRDILNTYPNLVSPEETHFYRWGHPFGTQEYMNILRNNPTLKKHREIDGISEELFEDILKIAISRRDLFIKYMEAFKSIRKPTAMRWFDKTPQNIYGVLLMHHDFPNAKFIHIVRNPYNIVASLRLGKVISVPDLVGACNYWTEAVSIANQLKKLNDSAFYEIRYEDLAKRPRSVIIKLLRFLDEKKRELSFNLENIYREKNQQKEILSDEDRGIINDVCGQWMHHYNYSLARNTIISKFGK